MKYIYLLLALLMLSSVSRAQVSSENYILTKSVVASGDTLVSIQYYDGLGREQEFLRKNYSDNGNKDLITLNQYDGMGNLHRSWAPVPYPSTSLQISEDAICSVATKVYEDTAPYTLYEYDKTENNLLCKEYGPGCLWMKNGKAKEIYYGGNVANVFPMFKLSSDKNSFLFSEYYASGTLTEIKTIDEDGVSKAKYYDIFGRLILEQNGSGAITYYIYDNDGNLTFVLPPAAYERCAMAKNVNHSITEDECLKKYAYFYRYDERGRCIETKLPGCELIKMYYDKDNKLIFKQDGNQRAKNEWMFLLYDSYGRVTVRGVCKNADKINIANINVQSTFLPSGKYAMYDTNISLDIKDLLKVNYYDNYAFLEEDSLYNYQSHLGYDEDIIHDGNKVVTKGLLTGCRTYVLQSSNASLITPQKYNTQSFYYNNKGEVVQIHRGNIVGGIDDVYYHLNPYTGSILKKKLVHHASKSILKNANAAIVTITKRYVYDSDGRLNSMMCKLDDNDEFLVRHNEYDDMGRLARTTSHDDALSTSYTYNVKDQPVSVVNSLTEQHLYYNTPYVNSQNTLSYNGNLSAYEWKGNIGGKWDASCYSYEYDEANRLISAHSISKRASEVTEIGQHDTHYDYDVMGNIIGVTRKGINYDNGVEGNRDDATLEYNGNQLIHISNIGYKDSSSDTQIADREYSNVEEIQYDANGNMTRNLNKGILKVAYNELNLPEYIYMDNNQYLHNTYDGDGNKLSTERGMCKYNITIPESGTVIGNLDTLNIKTDLLNADLPETTYYSGDFIYKSEKVDLSKPLLSNVSMYVMGNHYANKQVLSRINFEEGYIVPNKSKERIYDYVKDFLGNIRFVVSNGHVVEKNDYYPFGGFYDADNNSYYQKWKFGNKELDRMIDQYYWGFRVYDPTVGEFTTVDPMCELNYGMSPYSFANNNPVNYTDLFGLRTYSWEELVRCWRNFDVENDDVGLPTYICTAKRPQNVERIYDESSEGLGRVKDFTDFVCDLNNRYGDVNLSQPLWNMARFVKHNHAQLAKKLNLSTFHPSHVYRGITNSINKINKYTRVGGYISCGMTALKIAATGSVSVSDTWDTVIPIALDAIPGYGWIIAGGYTLLDTGIKVYTGKDIGAHLEDFVREQYGYDTVDIYNF